MKIVVPGNYPGNKPDKSFAPHFERDLPPAHRAMLARVDMWRPITVVADAIRGFHFTTHVIGKIRPIGGNLYLFPGRPSVRQVEEISRLAARAIGWNRRGRELTDRGLVKVFCTEIVPSPEIANELVQVKKCGEFGSGRLMGIQVQANEKFTWRVRDSKTIRIED